MSDSDKKDSPEHLELKAGSDVVVDDFVPLSQEEDKKLTRKIDFHLIPYLSVLYLMSFLDRTAIGNAKTFGMEKSLGLTGSNFAVALTVFFVPYALFEPVSNLIIRRFRPSLVLPAAMIATGICLMSQGLVKNYGQLVAVRFLLGLFEAPLFPGVVSILSCWYTRRSYGLRAAIFFSAATASGAFGGLFAVGLSRIKAGTVPSWGWILLVEGLLTIFIACLGFYFMHDYPDNSKFLNEREKEGLIRRLKADSQESAAGEEFSWNVVGEVFRDPKTYVACLIYMGVDMPLYAFSLFTPTIIKELGFTSVKANLLSVPVYVSACLSTILVGFLADRTGRRYLLTVICLGTALVGYILLISVPSPSVRLFACFLSAAGIYPCIPSTVAWVGGNSGGATRRSLLLGVMICSGNICGAISSNVYRAPDAPRYRLGHGLVMLFVCIGLTAATVYAWMLKRENAARDRGECNEIIDSSMAPGTFSRVRDNRTFSSDHEAKLVLGDRHSSYRYVY